MAEILLSSEKMVKSITSVSNNLSGKYILPALREVQEIRLRNILGSCLLDKLKADIAAGTLADQYKELVDLPAMQYFLANATIAEVALRPSYKVGNFGVTKTQDENMQVATWEEIAKVQYYYQGKADSYCLQLQQYLLNNCAAFPELDSCACERIHANLKSAASCGIYTGGARGKIIRR